MSPITIAHAAIRRLMSPASTVAELKPYTTLMELRAALRVLDDVRNVTVVLVLDERFCGNLASLVERPVSLSIMAPAMRLVLAVGSGRLPGLQTIGDLAASGAALGWQEIVLEMDAEEAVAGALATLRPDESVIAFVPSWQETAGVERLLERVA